MEYTAPQPPLPFFPNNVRGTYATSSVVSRTVHGRPYRHGPWRVYRLAYVPHNYHFLWATATLEGRSELAIQSAREMAVMVNKETMRQRGLTTLQHYWITPLYALVRFGHWDEILAWPEPAADLIYPRGVWHYARGMALTRKDQLMRHDKSWWR